MDRNFLKEKVKFLRRKKRRSDFFLRAFVAIYILGYIFFFSSPYFFPKVYRGVEVAYPGEMIAMEGYMFTLDAWDYAKTEDAFEIILSVKNLSLEENPEYHVMLRSGNTSYKSKIEKNIGGNLLVIRANGIPKRWTEIMMTLRAGKKSSTIWMNDKTVRKVDRIEERTEEEYQRYAITSRISGIQNHVEEEKEEVQSLSDTIISSQKRMEDMMRDKEGEDVGEKEKEEIQKNISSLSSSIESLKGTIDEKMIEIAEEEKRIKVLEEKLA